jgi:predicted RNase H-like nuclease (RuvC/YqgF family)
MKIVSLFAVLAIAVCLVGCENAELVTCQQDKDLLQGQLDQANTAIMEKDANIEALKAKNIEDQNTAMKSITTMMTKQAAKDKKLNDALTQKKQEVTHLQQKVTALQAQIDTHVCPVPEAVAIEEVEE